LKVSTRCCSGMAAISFQRVTIPRQSRGLSNVSRSKRLNGDANAAPQFLSHPGWPKKSTPEVQLIEALILMLLVTNILTDHRLVSTYRRNEVTPRPEMLPHKIAFPLAVNTG